MARATIISIEIMSDDKRDFVEQLSEIKGNQARIFSEQYCSEHLTIAYRFLQVNTHCL